MTHSFRSLTLVTILMAFSAPALAEEAPATSFHGDFEIDPTAYALGGQSLHVGLGWKRVRVDLGAFGLTLPSAAVGNDDFAVAFDGYGVKLQYFLFAEQRGGFVGIDGAVDHTQIERRGTDLARRRTSFSAGVNFGWRFVFAGSFYATPWLGLGHTFNDRPVTLAASTYEPNRLVVFPAVHLGYRFR
jgi:hypothetical protein